MAKAKRPFAGLTWAQLSVLHKAASSEKPHYSRAIWVLSQMENAPIKRDKNGVALTDFGHQIWAQMKEWRPDLYE